ASNRWRWFGYENSWVVLDGNTVQSVSGGGHWGGGMFIDAYDMGRFGYLTLRHGKWKSRQLISNQWVDWALTPTPAQPTYGFMNWFLNTNRQLLPSAPASAFVHIGNGTNMIFVDPDHDLVAVARWIDGGAMDGFVKRLLAAANATSACRVRTPSQAFDSNKRTAWRLCTLFILAGGFAWRLTRAASWVRTNQNAVRTEGLSVAWRSIGPVSGV